MSEPARQRTELDGQGLGWLDEEGPDLEIVLSTRVRLARNVQGFPFAVKASGEERERLLDRARDAIAAADILGSTDLWEMNDLDASERTLLLERHLVSRELIVGAEGRAPRGAALALSRERTLGLMVNEEDTSASRRCAADSSSSRRGATWTGSTRSSGRGCRTRSTTSSGS